MRHCSDGDTWGSVGDVSVDCWRRIDRLSITFRRVVGIVLIDCEQCVDDLFMTCQ